MQGVLDFLGQHPVLLLFIFMGLGMAVGHIRVKAISLGAAAVLFVAIGLTAFAVAQGQGEVWAEGTSELAIVGDLGLALFTYTVGVTSGPNFFASLRSGLGPIGAMIGVLLVAAVAGWGVGNLLGLDSSLIAGTWSGAITNTPALAAAQNAASLAAKASGGDAAAIASAAGNATIGYSVAYLFGVIGMLVATVVALSHRAKDTDTPAPLVNLTVRVERSDRPRIKNIESANAGKVAFSRVRHGEENPILIADADDVLEQDDLVTVVGPRDLVTQIARDLGHASSHMLEADRRYLDFRRITLSNGKLAGRTIADLDLVRRFGATISRVRRGDVDMVATDSLVLQPGDRIRVIAPTGQMKKVSAYFGDSSRGLSDINPMAMGLGMSLGILLGLIPIPLPGGGTFSIGTAAGTLLVGLVMGRLGRVGPLITTMPHLAATALSELGLMAFLAYAGMRAGGQVAKAFTGGLVIDILLTGVVITTIVAAGVYLLMRHVFHMGGTKLSGLLGGTQTQPAVLAYANQRTGYDNRVAMGYALVYPTAMVVKILIAQILGGL